MYFEDLSLYRYYLPFCLPCVHCVGWLDALHPYATGEVAGEVAEKLKTVIDRQTDDFDIHVNVVRGIHPCNLCGEDVAFVGGNGFPRPLGMSEIWIPCELGFFAAPSMIYHYIVRHRYRPPDEFIRALVALRFDEPFVSQVVHDEEIRASMPNP